MQKFRVGVDIGGTFTDIVFLGDGGQVLARKIASTPDDYSEAVFDGLKVGVAGLGIRRVPVKIGAPRFMARKKVGTSTGSIFSSGPT